MAHSISTSSTSESPSPIILKRKRTSRHRTLHPPPPSAAASSASSTTNEEEEDMANCLILLAQGHTFPVNEPTIPPSGPAGPAGRAVLDVYECKTCSKCFSSFQALGGHRASHKKPKITASEAELTSSMAKTMVFSPTGGGKQRTHECSTCGAEFASGQALGGHMRRHRQSVILPNNLEVNKKEKRVLLLDLNLPAPNDDEPFVAGNPLVFSPPVAAAAALVDCLY